MAVNLLGGGYDQVMRNITFSIMVLLLAFSAMADQPAPKDQLTLKEPITITNNLRAYRALTSDGRSVIYVTNLTSDGKRMGGAYSTSRSATITASRVSTSSRTTAQPRIIVSRQNVLRNTVAPQIISGIPVCMWRGRSVSPVRMGDRLVCPSESSPYFSQ